MILWRTPPSPPTGKRFRWFAWFPVEARDPRGGFSAVWLEEVERELTVGGPWIYWRLP